MSRTRYFPVSQSFLSDPETVEMRDKFGDRSVFMWMSLLSAGELNEGNILGTPSYIARIHGQNLDRTHPERALKLLEFLISKKWITPLYMQPERGQNEAETKAEQSHNPPVYHALLPSLTPPYTGALTVGYFITNYWKYHRKPVTKPTPEYVAASRSPNLPNLSEPNLLREEKKKSKSQLPTNFTISELVKKWGVENEVDPALHLEAFIDYHKAKASLRADWDAAFRVWLRNAKRFGTNGNGKSQSKEDQLRAKTERILRQGL